MNAQLVAIAIASLAGSLHCAGMCGGLVGLYAGCGSAGRSGAHLSHVIYNGARLLAYLTLGALAGFAGAALDLGGDLGGVQRVSAILAGSMILFWAGMRLLPQGGKLSAALARPLSRLGSLVAPRVRGLGASARALGLGLLSGILPCGWLYLFVVAAAGSGGVFEGMSIMGAFWLGTVPALLGVGYGIGLIGTTLRTRMKPLATVALLVLGLVTLLGRAQMIGPTDSGGVPACHDPVSVPDIASCCHETR